jgi:hypothetical protein
MTTTAKIDGEAMTDEWRTAFDDRHEFDVYPEHFMSGLRNEFAAGWHAAMKSQARALLASKQAVTGHFGSFEKWAENYGFHAELVDVHQYAKEAARDAWTSGYMAGYLEGGLDEADNTPTAPAQPCGEDAVCSTCNGHGMIGGPSYYSPDEGGEPCPDCNAPVQCGEDAAEQADEAVTIKVDKDRFDQLMDALDRAESKGYMPDAIAQRWSAFEWEIVPPSRAKDSK